MKKEYMLIADLVLKRLPIGQQANIRAMLSSIMYEEGSDKYGQETYDKMCEIVKALDGGVRQFMLNEGYLTILAPSVPFDMLSEKGIQAKRLGGHEKYKEWEEGERAKKEKEANELKKITWPQKNWLLLTLATAIIFPLLVEWLRPKLLKDTNPQPQIIQAVHDTVYIYDNHNTRLNSTDTFKKGQ
jgi:hypothetical protein